MTKRVVAAMMAAVGLLAATAGAVLGAFQTVELSADSGTIGAEVAVRIEISTRVGTSNPSELFLVDETAYAGSAHCGEIRGAVILPS